MMTSAGQAPSAAGVEAHVGSGRRHAGELSPARGEWGCWISKIPPPPISPSPTPDARHPGEQQAVPDGSDAAAEDARTMLQAAGTISRGHASCQRSRLSSFRLAQQPIRVTVVEPRCLKYDRYHLGVMLADNLPNLVVLVKAVTSLTRMRVHPFPLNAGVLF